MSGHTTFVRSAKLIHVGPVLRRARQTDVGALRDGDTGQSGDACERQPTGARAGCCAQRRQRAPRLRLCARRLYACGHRVWRMAPPSSPRLHGVEEGENRAEAAHIMAPVLELEVRLHASVHVRRAHGRKRPPPALFPAPAPHPALRPRSSNLLSSTKFEKFFTCPRPVNSPAARRRQIWESRQQGLVRSRHTDGCTP